MEALIILIALVVLAILAMRFGHDSRPGIQSHDAILSDIGYRIDPADMPEEPVSRPAMSAPSSRRLADAHR